MKKRYRFSFDYEIELKDLEEVEVLRDEWPEETSGEYIVERLIAVKKLLAKLMGQPEVLERYMRYRALTMMDTPPRVQEIADQVGVESDPEMILTSTLAELDEDARQHFLDAAAGDQFYEALVPFWAVFSEELIGVSFEELSKAEYRG